ncbi:hypothetical protein [Streptomyces sp. 8N706]|uniref:hypothetical protein n=1 Tax=Streptomyces sp. 8N706 TaxID=3457416 RepID=UPI003FD5EA23
MVQLQKIRRATMVALMVGGLASTGSGIAFAGGGGATATGGSSTGGDLFQQNTAQVHRQNNNCASPNSLMADPAPTGFRGETSCVTGDASFNKNAAAKGGGAHTTGGSGDLSVEQQNTAQTGRQNNNCANPNDFTLTAIGDSRADSRCTDKDRSRNKHTLVKGGGAHTTGGSATTTVSQQNTAQEGRQNNNCANPNTTTLTAIDGRVDSRCTNKDRSRNKHTLVKGGGAHTIGGSSAPGFVTQQNTAQEGRQNNNCANPNQSDVVARDGGLAANQCTNKDRSKNKHTLTKGGGAHTIGGSSAAVGVVQQNTAQEGRQNNNCANPNNSTIVASEGGLAANQCTNKDRSKNKHTLTKGGGAHTIGGSSAAVGVSQQNTAQEGRQNNNCANPNGSTIVASEGGLAANQCTNKDRSKNKHTLTKGGGAQSTGGSSAGGVFQQNTAQEGRQNNNCANPNLSDINLPDSRTVARCKTVDHSKNVGTAEIGDGAKATGGSSTLGLFQQNTAQEGRQNNNCGNPNNLTLTATGSRSQVRCVAVDKSKNIGSGHHHR